ncbi:MAG: hypothetical protein GXP55_10590 [Deltaproteobacteria bacterium]|nr:hypothetical protein [Deltaproteobacteria bacterium]
MFRLYSEHVPLGEIDAPLLRGLRAYGVELAVAAFAGHEDEYHALARRAQRAQVPLVVWPLLDDARGRWPSGGNVAAFREHVLDFIEGLAPGTLLFDLEPPLAWTRAALRLARELRERGWRLESVVPPMLVYGRRWERWLGTPAAELACARMEPMAYTSLFEGYSRGLVSRRVARDLLVRITRRSGGAVALGVVGPGALGDERAYRDVDELRDDVSLARAAGATRLSLYALDGLLERGAPERWLEAFTRTRAGALPRATRRGALLEFAGALLG